LKWLVIQTRLVDYTAFEPLLDTIETSDDKVEALKELEENLRELERNDMWITAIPLEVAKKKLEDKEKVRRICLDCLGRYAWRFSIGDSIEVVMEHECEFFADGRHGH